jgi:2-haloacid dehalogenase
MLRLTPVPKIITFDCYGTLVQWHRTMRDAASSVLLAHLETEVMPAQVASLADKIRSNATAHQQRQPYRRYEAVLRSSLEEALADIGEVATEEDHRTLWTTLWRIDAHPDTPAALTQLSSRYKLAVISNTDDALIAGTIEAIGAPLDFVITAQQAGAYKPNHRLFEYAHEQMKVTKDETIHVAMGQFTDLKVCTELGIRSVSINRDGEALDRAWSTDAILADLSTLPKILATV